MLYGVHLAISGILHFKFDFRLFWVKYQWFCVFDKKKYEKIRIYWIYLQWCIQQKLKIPFKRNDISNMSSSKMENYW
jgi:hypothetical protein